MTASNAPSLHELFSKPADHIYQHSIARPADLPQLQEQIAALDDARRLALYDQHFAKALSQLPPDFTSEVAGATHSSINEQLGALRFNRLPYNVLSNIFTYLSTENVVNLRRTNHVWNMVAQTPASFRDEEVDGGGITLRQPVSCQLAGLKALAIEPKAEFKKRKMPDSFREYIQQNADAIFECIASSQHQALRTLALRPTYFEHAPHPLSCTLSSLCRHDFRHQLKSLSLMLNEDNDWSELQSAAPFAALTHLTLQVNSHSVPELDTLTMVAHLVPTLEDAIIILMFAKVMTLRPLLQLPRLRALTFETTHVRDDDILIDSPLQLLGDKLPAPTLHTLHIVAPNKMNRLLTESTAIGFSQLASNLSCLHLQDVEHRSGFAQHLARCQQLTSLELTSPTMLEHATDNYRDQLLATLPQLPKLRLLKLHWNDDRRRDINENELTERYQEWTAKHLRCLLRLPLDELWVHCTADTAGRALKLFTTSQPPTLTVLRLGRTDLDYHHLAAACSCLQRFSMSVDMYRNPNSCSIYNRPTDLYAIAADAPSHGVEQDELPDFCNQMMEGWLRDNNPCIHFWHQWDDED